ncbi:MAG: saccharopine dehydrogenase NADP-binding domain-containing protein [Verrucomicrobiota bacterium]
MPYKNHQNKEIDVVIYGATGFAGKLIAEYFQNAYTDSDVRWAMAGRNLDKLQRIRDEITAPPDTLLLTSDSKDISGLSKIARQAKVVLSTVGPFTLYGQELVKACVEAGTDYIDLCGEANFIREMIDLHSANAQQTGARIIFSCGFDSLPLDLGVHFLQKSAKEQFGKHCLEVRARVQAMSGEFSGGTAESFKVPVALGMKNPKVMDYLVDPFSLTPGFKGPKQPCDQTPTYEEDLESWSGPFFMGSINRQNVHRSNALMGFPYSKDFIYSEMRLTGAGEDGKAAAQALAEDQWIFSEDAPKPGEGPSRDVRENGFYEIAYLGKTSSGERITLIVRGDMDPGYGSTAKIVSECALCLIENQATTPGGIWTGSSAMGDVLRQRLAINAGLTFDLKS